MKMKNNILRSIFVMGAIVGNMLVVEARDVNEQPANYGSTYQQGDLSIPMGDDSTSKPKQRQTYTPKRSVPFESTANTDNYRSSDTDFWNERQYTKRKLDKCRGEARTCAIYAGLGACGLTVIGAFVGLIVLEYYVKYLFWTHVIADGTNSGGGPQ